MEERQVEFVPFGEIRNVPETINASIDFLRLHGKRLGKLILNRAFPVLLFAQLVYLWIDYSRSPVSVATPQSYFWNQILKLSIWGVCYVVGWTLLVGIVHSYLRLAETYEFEEFSNDDVWHDAKALFWRTLGTNIGFAVICIACASIGLAFVGSDPIVGSFFYLLSALFFATIWSLYYAARLLDDYGFFESFGRSQRLVQGRFWQTSGLVITLGLLCAAILGSLTALYGYLILLSWGKVGNPAWAAQNSTVIQILVSVIVLLFSTAANFLYVGPMVSFAIYYRSQEERKDSTMLRREIESIARVEKEEDEGEEKTTDEMTAASEAKIVEDEEIVELESSLLSQANTGTPTKNESDISGGVGNMETEDDERG